MSDNEIIGTLKAALDEAGPDAKAVSARAVSDGLPIKRPATKKRLDKLAQEEGNGVRRFRSAQAWHYWFDERPSAPGTTSNGGGGSLPSSPQNTTKRTGRPMWRKVWDSTRPIAKNYGFILVLTTVGMIASYGLYWGLGVHLDIFPDANAWAIAIPLLSGAFLVFAIPAAYAWFHDRREAKRQDQFVDQLREVIDE